MSTLLQISDTHFGTERPDVVEALVRLAQSAVPDLVVLSGDITQRARPSQFDAARVFVDRLGPRALVAIPGNHDIPLFNLVARVFAPYANYARVFGSDLEPEFESPRLLVLCVNTTRPHRHKDGELSTAQIERVAARVRRAASAQLRIVVVHQPVLAIRASDEDNLLNGREQAIPLWSAAGVDIIMGGHIHLPYTLPMRLDFAALPRDVWTVQAGTGVSARVRDGIENSVNILRCNGTGTSRGCDVERWDYSPAHDRFERYSTETLTFTDPVPQAR